MRANGLQNPEHFQVVMNRLTENPNKEQFTKNREAFLPEQVIPARNIRQETIALGIKRAANIFVGCFSLALHKG